MPWTATSTTVSADAVLDPNGLLTADAITSTSTTGLLLQEIFPAPLCNPSGDWEVSLWLKAPAATTATLTVQWDDLDGECPSAPGTLVEIDVAVTTTWTRVAYNVNFDAGCDCTPAGTGPPEPVIRLGIHAGDYGSTTGTIHVWGAQLERGSSASTYVRHPAPPIANPECVLEDHGAGIELLTPPYDYSGDALRLHFMPKCVFDAAPVPDRNVEDCALLGGVEYYEARFGVTAEEIASGAILGDGIVAAGNYNYRLNRIAVNLVGTNVKDCALDPTASCFANMFVPYELIQFGTVFLEDHSGDTHVYALPEAHIHGGKAVAAEMVFTSPLSGANQTILDDFWKTELIGRPLNGSYALRIHHVPSLVWENLEDVQIILDYRYWSAFAP